MHLVGCTVRVLEMKISPTSKALAVLVWKLFVLTVIATAENLNFMWKI
jgi:hypothetical protein